MAFFQNPHAFDTVHSRQTNIGQHHIRELMTDAIERFFHRTIAAGARVTVGAIDQKSQTLADVALVLDDRHLDRRRHSSRLVLISRLASDVCYIDSSLPIPTRIMSPHIYAVSEKTVSVS